MVLKTILILIDQHSMRNYSPKGGIIANYALSRYGIKIPEDIALIASERAMVSRYCLPAQTTISQDYPALVKAAVNLIDAGINGEKMLSQTIFPYKLIVRDSVRPRKS